MKQVEDVVKDEGLNVLLNNAGIAPKSVRLAFTQETDLIRTYETNSVAPVMLSKVLDFKINIRVITPSFVFFPLVELT